MFQRVSFLFLLFTEFFAAAANLSSSPANATDIVAYPMLKNLPCSGLDLLVYIFNLSCNLLSFASIWKTSPLFSSIRWESLSTLLLCFGLSLSLPAYQSFLNASFHPFYSFFWNLIPFSLPARPVSTLDGLHSIKFFVFLSPFRMDLTNPSQDLGRSLLLINFDSDYIINFSKAFDWDFPLSFISLFRLTFLLTLFDGLKRFFLTGAFQKHASRFIRVCQDIPPGFLALFYCLFCSTISMRLYLLPSAALFRFTTGLSGSPLPWYLVLRRPHKEI